MRTIHIKGYSDKLDIVTELSNNPDFPDNFYFDEESEEVIKNCFIRMFCSDSKCSLEDAMKGWSRHLFGDIKAVGQQCGYSEYTIEGFNVTKATIGGHDIQEILDDKKSIDGKPKYVHILIDVEIKS